jgi:hypothetical protein
MQLQTTKYGMVHGCDMYVIMNKVGGWPSSIHIDIYVGGPWRGGVSSYK